MRKLTEAQAWLVIAEWFAMPYSEETSTGLCRAQDRLFDKRKLTVSIYDKMCDRLSDAMAEWHHSYIFMKYDEYGCFVNDTSQEARDARCMVALLFALEASGRY